MLILCSSYYIYLFSKGQCSFRSDRWKLMELKFLSFTGCKNQEGKRRIDVQALLLSAQPVSTLQLVNPYNFVTGLAVIACLCIIILFAIVFIVLQVCWNKYLRVFHSINAIQCHSPLVHEKVLGPCSALSYNVYAIIQMSF